MKEIPQNCIDIFKEKFNSFPSIVDVNPSINKEDSDKFYGKHHLLWFQTLVNDEHNVVYQNRLYEYDSTGILILRKSDTKIFILTKADKQNAVDFLLQQIKRLTIKKD
jgi:hypothetical protein